VNSRKKIPSVDGDVHLVEHPGCAAGAQHVDVVDAVRPAGHRADDRGQLADRVHLAGGHTRGRQVHMLADQFRKPGLLSQFQHRHQPGGRHQIPFVEHRRVDGEGIR
jgi:hypothetical protein